MRHLSDQVLFSFENVKRLLEFQNILLQDAKHNYLKEPFLD